MPNSHVAIPVALAQQLLNYLALRPYAEVYSMIAEISKAQQITIEPPGPTN